MIHWICLFPFFSKLKMLLIAQVSLHWYRSGIATSDMGQVSQHLISLRYPNIWYRSSIATFDIAQVSLHLISLRYRNILYRSVIAILCIAQVSLHLISLRYRNIWNPWWDGVRKLLIRAETTDNLRYIYINKRRQGENICHEKWTEQRTKRCVPEKCVILWLYSSSLMYC